MEEQKNASVNAESTQKEENVKLTYEQLNNACNQLAQQNHQLVAKVRELEQIVMLKRLDYLFKVLNYSSNFSSEFVSACANEIEAAMTPPANEESAEENTETKEK